PPACRLRLGTPGARCATTASSRHQLSSSTGDSGRSLRDYSKLAPPACRLRPEILGARCATTASSRHQPVVFDRRFWALAARLQQARATSLLSSTGDSGRSLQLRGRDQLTDAFRDLPGEPRWYRTGIPSWWQLRP